MNDALLRTALVVDIAVHGPSEPNGWSMPNPCNPRGATQCLNCPAREDCLLGALATNDLSPLRGGLTRAERTSLFAELELLAQLLDPDLLEVCAA